MSLAALKSYLESLQDWQRDEIWFDRYNEAGRLAQQFSLSRGDVRNACRDIDQEAAGSRRWPFLWLAEINRVHGAGRISVKGLKVAIGLFGFANPARPYVWPNQQLIAERAGWSPKNRRGVFEGLKELEDIGAIRRLRYKDLPKDVLADATKAGQQAEKDPRCGAYCFCRVEEWEKVDVSPLGKHTSVSPGEALNYKVQQQPASPDSLAPPIMVDSLPFLHSSPLNYGTDQGETHRYATIGEVTHG